MARWRQARPVLYQENIIYLLISVQGTRWCHNCTSTILWCIKTATYSLTDRNCLTILDIFLARYFLLLNYFVVLLLSILNTEKLPEFITLININMITVLIVHSSNFHIFLGYVVLTGRAGKTLHPFVIKSCSSFLNYLMFKIM